MSSTWSRLLPAVLLAILSSAHAETSTSAPGYPFLSSAEQQTNSQLSERQSGSDLNSQLPVIDAILAARDPSTPQPLAQTWPKIRDQFPVQSDWILQDAGPSLQQWLTTADPDPVERRLIHKALSELPAYSLSRLLTNSLTPAERLSLYLRACELRRAYRLTNLLAKTSQILFTKRHTVRPSFFAYTEGQSDAQHERHFLPGAELCLLQMHGLYGRVRTLVADPTGAIRDPALSWEADRVLFAWKKHLDNDDYHLYELDLKTVIIRQITAGLGFADYEPAYLPNDHLIFSSTRCVQTVDCFWTEVSNLYTCDPDGRAIRRLTFDQVHSIYPQVLDDARIIYTRWDYNDRGQVFPQPLFQMNMDGTAQTEFYGNNSWFPTTIAHARGIPGTQKVLAILCGHHTSQAGKLAIIDPARGRQENQGVQLVAPIRETPAERIDAYGQTGPLWQYPFPLSETECLVTYAPLGWESSQRRRGDADFAIYWMHIDGRRELLVADPELPCAQPVPVIPRRRPALRPTLVDDSRTNGIFYIQDIYAGTGLEGIPRGTVKKLRVVALDFRPTGIGQNFSSGPGGGALISTPISIGNGAWDVKTVLGEADVYPDGSALFAVPARTPVYFQAIDERGYAVQTMRSWSTLQPGETLSCVGCHESKNSAPPPPVYGSVSALRRGVQPLKPFYGPPRGFSFQKEIQPILDRHCTRCHNHRSLQPPAISAVQTAKRRLAKASEPQAAFSLLGTEQSLDPVAKRTWSDAYLALTAASRDNQGAFRGEPDNPLVNWISSQSAPEPLPPYTAGAARSRLMHLLTDGHSGVTLSCEELEKVACWIDLLVPYCGDYLEANAWTEDELGKYSRYAAKRLLNP